jgi:diadenosine tetraphosphatase ApaH/serine/threonine PP2A family protein phosphatase
MRIALLADVHANAAALRACLAHARAERAARFAFLGDLVGYGPDPGEVVDLVAEHAARGAIVVKGNHDEAIDVARGYVNDTAARAIEWSRRVLTPAQRGYLAQLPLCVREDGHCYVHACAVAPGRWTYVDSEAAALRSMDAAVSTQTYSGHVHEQRLYVAHGDRATGFTPRAGIAIPTPLHRRSLVLAGSVGQPRDGNTAAAYALADTGMREITFHRVAYDHHETARRIRAAGLPEMLAYRIERGA